MTAEQETAIQKLAELTIKLDRVKLAAERIAAIFQRANRRTFQDVHSHEAKALANNADEIIEILGPPEVSNIPGPFWTEDKVKAVDLPEE